MTSRARIAAAVLASGLWVNASEFFRNGWLLKAVWLTHYQGLGIPFPSQPRNAAVWIVWGFGYAGGLCLLSRRCGWPAAALIGWFLGFALMWLVTWNLAVLPPAVLWPAVPLSLIESGVAAWLCARIAPAAGGAVAAR